MAKEKYIGHDAHYLEHEKTEEARPCYFCLEGWVFIGSVGHDGEEVIESVRCRRCKGKGRIQRL